MPKYILPTINQKLTKRALIPISQAAKFLNLSADTLRNWEKEGKINPLRTKGGSRRYSLVELRLLKEEIGTFKPKSHSMLSISRAANLLKVSKDTLRNWERKGLVETSRTKGGSRRFSKLEINRLIQELDIQPGIKPEIKIEPKDKFGGWGLTSGLMLIALLLVVFVASLLYQLTGIQPVDSHQEQVLGEKTQSLQDQIYQLATTAEDLQKKVMVVQEPPAPQYIYLPQTNLKATLDSELLTAKSASFDGIKLGEVNLLSGSSAPNSDLGSSGDYYLRKGGLEIGLYLKTGSDWSQYNQNNQSSLQKAYDLDNTLSISDNRDLNINIAGKSAFIVTSEGKVGIGTALPTTNLDVLGNSTISPILKIQDTAVLPSDSDILRIISNSGSAANTVFRVDSEGDLFLDGVITSGNADLAEEYNSLDDAKAGEIVVTKGKEDIVKSSVSYQKNIIGVISSDPGFRLSLKKGSQSIFNPRPVALAGRVKVLVSSENGPISAGDYLTSSLTPGVAMKATSPGSVVGKALEDFTDEGISQVMMFVSPTFADPGNVLSNLILDKDGSLIIPKLKTEQLLIGSIDNQYLSNYIEQSQEKGNIQDLPITVAAKLESLQSKVLENQKSNAKTQQELVLLKEEIGQLKEVISTSSASLYQTVLVAEFKVLANKISGQGIIEKGQKSVDITNSLVDHNSRILITPTTETDLVLAVTEKKDHEKFKVSAPKIVEEALNFDWWMVGEEEKD